LAVNHYGEPVYTLATRKRPARSVHHGRALPGFPLARAQQAQEGRTRFDSPGRGVLPLTAALSRGTAPPVRRAWPV